MSEREEQEGHGARSATSGLHCPMRRAWCKHWLECWPGVQLGLENIFKATSTQHEFSPRRTGCLLGQMIEEEEARLDMKAAKTTKVSFGCGFQRTIEEECGHRLSGKIGLSHCTLQ